ncbi:hypothetical protein ACFLVC_01480 [Chloroflexota bacterium]
MKKLLFIITVIGFITLSGVCFYLEIQIDTAKSDILNLTSVVNLQEVKIAETESELDLTTSSLKETESELIVVYNERNQLLELKEELEKELIDTEQKLDLVKSNLQLQEEKTSELQIEVEAVQVELEAIREELQLYHDTGITVAQGTVPRYRTSLYDSFDLENNPDAINISWSQLKDFLKEDRTDNIPYVENVFTCGEFAETLHNNAENSGIKVAWVGIQFEDGSIGHALNAFVTTDRGLVYIDVTGWPSNADGPYHSDRIVSMRVGRPLYETFLFPSDWEMINDGPGVAQVGIYW